MHFRETSSQAKSEQLLYWRAQELMFGAIDAKSLTNFEMLWQLNKYYQDRKAYNRDALSKKCSLTSRWLQILSEAPDAFQITYAQRVLDYAHQTRSPTDSFFVAAKLILRTPSLSSQFKRALVDVAFNLIVWLDRSHYYMGKLRKLFSIVQTIFEYCANDRTLFEYLDNQQPVM